MDSRNVMSGKPRYVSVHSRDLHPLDRWKSRPDEIEQPMEEVPVLIITQHDKGSDSKRNRKLLELMVHSELEETYV